jgi:hypothetical protein
VLAQLNSAPVPGAEEPSPDTPNTTTGPDDHDCGWLCASPTCTAGSERAPRPAADQPYWTEDDGLPVLAIPDDSYRYVDMPDVAAKALLDLIRSHRPALPADVQVTEETGT